MLLQIYFPIHYEGHWFVVVVHTKGKKFIILDPCHRDFDENSEYHRNFKDIFIPNFIKIWNEIDTLDMGFHGYQTIFADVPQCSRDEDVGIFIMKFLQL
uniref:Ubiquitin-like protease family profile domain-containing protein n=1 Tax=Arundo donax TaxID=35708 RepID=A0A0A9DRW8_ARUDO